MGQWQGWIGALLLVGGLACPVSLHALEEPWNEDEHSFQVKWEEGENGERSAVVTYSRIGAPFSVTYRFDKNGKLVAKSFAGLTHRHSTYGPSSQYDQVELRPDRLKGHELYENGVLREMSRRVLTAAPAEDLFHDIRKATEHLYPDSRAEASRAYARMLKAVFDILETASVGTVGDTASVKAKKEGKPESAEQNARAREREAWHFPEMPLDSSTTIELLPANLEAAERAVHDGQMRLAKVSADAVPVTEPLVSESVAESKDKWKEIEASIARCASRWLADDLDELPEIARLDAEIKDPDAPPPPFGTGVFRPAPFKLPVNPWSVYWARDYDALKNPVWFERQFFWTRPERKGTRFEKLHLPGLRTVQIEFLDDSDIDLSVFVVARALAGRRLVQGAGANLADDAEAWKSKWRQTRVKVKILRASKYLVGGGIDIAAYMVTRESYWTEEELKESVEFQDTFRAILTSPRQVDLGQGWLPTLRAQWVSDITYQDLSRFPYRQQEDEVVHATALDALMGCYFE